MRTLYRTIIRVVSVGASLAFAAPLVAQTSHTSTGLQISPYAGYMVFGKYLDGPLGTSITNAPATLYGAQVGLTLTRDLSLVGNLGYTASDIKIGVPIFGGVTAGHSNMLVYDANLEYNLGGEGGLGSATIAPFVQAGVGAIRYNIDASIITTQATNLAGNLGIGIDYMITPGMSLRFMGKDYIGKFDFQDATGLGISGKVAHNMALTAALRLDF